MFFKKVKNILSVNKSPRRDFDFGVVGSPPFAYSTIASALTRAGSTMNCRQACELVFPRKSVKDAQRIIAERFKGVKVCRPLPAK